MVKVEVPLLLLLVAPRLCECKPLCVCVCVTREKKKKKKTSDRPLEQLLSPVCVQCFTQTHTDMQSCIPPAHTYMLLSLPTSPFPPLCFSAVAGLTQPPHKAQNRKGLFYQQRTKKLISSVLGWEPTSQSVCHHLSVAFWSRNTSTQPRA